MEMKVQYYNLTAKDTEQIISLGFKINNKGTSDNFHDFINSAYPNFNIATFLQIIITTFSAISGKLSRKDIFYNPETLKLTIEILDDDNRLGFVRDFMHKDGMKIVEHAYFELPPSFQQKGIAKSILRESVQQYLNMNLTRIDIYAALDGGGYVWAKYGFTVTKKSEVDSIMKVAESQLNTTHFVAVQRVYSHYYFSNPDGNSFPILIWANMPFMKPILMGSSWHGELYLTNNEQFNNFILYVS